MNLYQIQDDDRPMYVVAASWMDALEAWKRQIEVENGIVPGSFSKSMLEPHGISLVCHGGKEMPLLLLPDRVAKKISKSDGDRLSGEFTIQVETEEEEEGEEKHNEIADAIRSHTGALCRYFDELNHAVREQTDLLSNLVDAIEQSGLQPSIDKHFTACAGGQTPQEPEVVEV